MKKTVLFSIILVLFAAFAFGRGAHYVKGQIQSIGSGVVRVQSIDYTYDKKTKAVRRYMVKDVYYEGVYSVKKLRAGDNVEIRAIANYAEQIVLEDY
jgi:hypothetical protein